MTPRPNIFVVGDAKCGTTTLYRMLQLGRGVGTSRTRKELHYFSAPELVQKVAGPGDERIPNDIVHDEAAYLAEFAHLPGGLAGVADVSPSYLQEPAAAARIRAFAPDARIVILLREPAAKIMSQYTHLWSEGRETLPFAEAFAASEARRAAGFSTMFDYEAGGRYAAAVERYLALFGRERVMVALFEELVADDPALRCRLEAFLGIRFAEGPPPRMNVGGRIRSPLLAALIENAGLRGGLKRLLPLGLRTRVGQAVRGAVAVEKPVLDPATAASLRARYAGDVARLEALIGRRTGWPAA
jgi:sulfotransferase family protein